MKLQRRSDTDAAIRRLQEGIQHIENSTREVARAEEVDAHTLTAPKRGIDKFPAWLMSRLI